MKANDRINSVTERFDTFTSLISLGNLILGNLIQIEFYLNKITS